MKVSEMKQKIENIKVKGLVSGYISPFEVFVGFEFKNNIGNKCVVVNVSDQDDHKNGNAFTKLDVYIDGEKSKPKTVIFKWGYRLDSGSYFSEWVLEEIN